MNKIPLLSEMCLTIMREDYEYPHTTPLPFEHIVDENLDQLFSNNITIEMPPDGKTLQISVPHNASITKLCEKVARALNTPFLDIRLLFNGKEGKKVAVGGGTNDRTLCEWTGIKLGESATATLIYRPSQTGRNYPEWPNQ